MGLEALTPSDSLSEELLESESAEHAEDTARNQQISHNHKIYNDKQIIPFFSFCLFWGREWDGVWKGCKSCDSNVKTEKNQR